MMRLLVICYHILVSFIVILLGKKMVMLLHICCSVFAWCCKMCF